MKHTLLFLVLLFFSICVYAQNQDTTADTIRYWKTSGQIGLAFSQVSLTNWAAGGQNSLSGNGILRLTASYNKNKSSWDSYLLTGYGFMKQGDSKLIKNDDKLELSSKYGYKASKFWYYSGLLDFRSQFAPGYSDPPVDTVKISDFFSPAYLIASLGMDFKPNDHFSLLISPATLKLTFVLDDSLSRNEAFGVKAGEKMRSEFGGFVKMTYKKDSLIQNVNLATSLDLFSNYFDHPERVDVNWELFIAMKINKLLTVTINTQLIYDYDIKFKEMENGLSVDKSKVQFKEVLGLGLSYNF